jgi:hypothetical protein
MELGKGKEKDRASRTYKTTSVKVEDITISIESCCKGGG